MAPRKGKRQGKKNNVKIKSKILPRKRILKRMKKTKTTEKPLENIKWLNKMPANSSVNQSETIPKWLNSCVYKHGRTPCSSSDNSSEYEDFEANDADDKSTSTDGSAECNCDHPNHPKYPDNGKCGILKHKISSSNSVVAKYIKSGMDHVASFIVESAIRFGEEHGVVVPDKNTPNVYEIMSPNKPFNDKCKKIRFKIPEKNLDYENSKRIMWKNYLKRNPSGGSTRSRVQLESKCSSWSSQTDSLEEILPLLEKLKEGGEIVSSELDLDRFRKTSDTESHERKRERERTRDKYRALEKRYKSADAMSKCSEDGDLGPSDKNLWKRFKRDSLEIGRQRLRAATCPRQQETPSPSPY